MSRLRIALAAVLALSALAVMAVPASASVPAANTKFCSAAEKIGSSSSASNASGLDSGQAKKVLAQFKATAKYAPAKVKSAIGNITKLLGVVAGSTNPADLAKVYTSSSFKNYPAAITTFFKYEAAQCTGGL